MQIETESKLFVTCRPPFNSSFDWWCSSGQLRAHQQWHIITMVTVCIISTTTPTDVIIHSIDWVTDLGQLLTIGYFYLLGIIISVGLIGLQHGATNGHSLLSRSQYAIVPYRVYGYSYYHPERTTIPVATAQCTNTGSGCVSLQCTSITSSLFLCRSPSIY